MDELSLLSNVRDDVPERSREASIAGRATLLHAVEHTAPARAKTRRRWLWAGSASLATCALAGTFVFAGAFGVPGRADPAAAAVLEAAAAAARVVADPVVAPGRYLQVRTDAVYSGGGSTAADIEEARLRGDSDGTTAPSTSFLESADEVVWIPADRSDAWTWVRCDGTVVQTFGPRSEALAAEHSEERPSLGWRGTLLGGRTSDGSTVWGFLSRDGRSDDFASLPRDPAELLQLIYDVNGNAGPSRDGEALVWIADTLRGPAVPAAVRSVLFDTAALIPGVTVTEQRATLNGRVGTALGRNEAEGQFRQEIIIDPDTGEFIGERTVVLRDVVDMPAGTAQGSTAVTTTVVDAIPEGMQACGQ